MRNNNRSGRRQYIYTRYLQRNVAYCTKSNLVQVKQTFSYLSKKNKNPRGSLVRLSVIEPFKKKKKTLLLARSCRSYTIQTKSKKGKKTKQKKTLPRGPQKHTPLLIKHGHAQVLHHTDGISGWWFGIMSPLAALANPFCRLLGDNSVVPKGFSETA